MAFMMITCLAAYLFVFFPWQLAHHGEHGYRIDIKWIGLNNMQEKTAKSNPIRGNYLLLLNGAHRFGNKANYEGNLIHATDVLQSRKHMNFFVRRSSTFLVGSTIVPHNCGERTKLSPVRHPSSLFL